MVSGQPPQPAGNNTQAVLVGMQSVCLLNAELRSTGATRTCHSPERADQRLDEVGGEPAGAGLGLAVVLQQWEGAQRVRPVPAANTAKQVEQTQQQAMCASNAALTSPITGLTASVAFSRW